MDTSTIEWDIVFALRLKSPIRLKRDIEFEVVARAVADHLRLAGWEFTRRPPASFHSTTPFMWPEKAPAPSSAPDPKPPEA